MRRTLYPMVLVLVFCGSCETRVRENLFDPLNPDTGGRPPLLRVIARNRFADLRWEDAGIPGLTSFAIYQGTDPDELEIVTLLPTDRRLYRAGGLNDDVTYYATNTASLTLWQVGSYGEHLSAAIRATDRRSVRTFFQEWGVSLYQSPDVNYIPREEGEDQVQEYMLTIILGFGTTQLENLGHIQNVVLVNNIGDSI